MIAKTTQEQRSHTERGDDKTMRIHKNRPQQFPEPWASDWGEDEYGLWMGFSYKGVKQVFRWIEPGTFLMGSPEDEEGRNDNETQHEVTLEQGYWLADTTVTQTLWKAVVGEAPSQFVGVNHPVENVSWNDAQRFIQSVNKLQPELLLCLPTEAQWEYACRAESSRRFSFGDEINPDQVVNGGLETEAVKNYSANNWGLFDMHGNVWEWCQDYFSDYITESEPELNSKAKKNSVSHVLRGGAWNSLGRHLRSASRSRSGIDYRYDYIGFRLVLGTRIQ